MPTNKKRPEPTPEQSAALAAWLENQGRKGKATPAAAAAAFAGDEKNLAVAMTPGGIDAQEKAGTQMVLEQQRLALDGTRQHRAYLESLGFVFGNDDGLLVDCALPPGWKLAEHPHPMWTRLLDADGAERALQFYKAAFYDKQAHINWQARYDPRMYRAASPDLPEDAEEKSGVPMEDQHACVIVYDHKRRQVIWKSDTLLRVDWQARDAARRAAHEWLAEHYPRYADPFAYWEDADAAPEQPQV